uniref:RBR-type E3 ubiquitin transferase n=1 Tax=Psilocybe cubensis TaxID=181762 RepID=A0A8H8CHA8_PSICU
MQRFLPEGTFRALVEAALVHHLDQHPQEWRYCTTPDCKQIYRRRSMQAALQCPSCFSTICPACDKEAHEGMTCEERRILKDPAEQQRLTEELAKEFGYKNCPQCDVLIEKTEGCNHMTCKCGAHICWSCMAVSDDRGPFNGNTIYVHMNTVHGNIYDQAPVGIDLGDVQNRQFVAEQADELARIERERIAAQQGARGQWRFQDHDAAGFHIAHAGPAQPQLQNVHNRLDQNERMRLVEENRRRLVEEENRRRQQLAEAEARRHRIAFEQRITRQRMENEELLARARAVQQRRDAEDRSWGCVLM